MKTCPLIALATGVIFFGSARADDTDLIWSTFLGGSDYDKGSGIATDASNNVYVTGCSKSVDFPTTTGAFDTSHNGGDYDIFVVRLDPAGSALAYATFLGGNGWDEGSGIAVDDSGNAYVTGYTSSADFPTTAGSFDTIFNGLKDVFVTKLNATGSGLVYTTFLGGSNSDKAYGIALDGSYNTFVTGGTSSTDFPTTAGAFDTTHNGCGDDVFVAKLGPTGSVLAYSTFLGGSYVDCGHAIAVDSDGNVYATGITCSADFPTTSGAFDETHNGFCDAFVIKLNQAGSNLVYATFLGGDSFDIGGGIVIDSSCDAYVAGTTGSTDFPTTTGAFDTTHKGFYDVFVTRLNTTGSAPYFSTLLGGSGYDYGYDVALDDFGNVYVIGATGSPGFPTTTGAFDTTLNGVEDAFVARLNPTGNALHYSTFLGGSSTDCGYAITTYGPGNAYVTGAARSADFPTTLAVFDETYNGNQDVFVVKLSIGTGNPSPPAAIDDLTVTLSNSDLVLSWSAVTVDTSGNPIEVDLYRVYRDTFILFEPGSEPFDSTTQTLYSDTCGVVGDTGVNYYYSVTAVSGGRESVRSHLVGEVDTGLINEPPEK